MGEHFDAYHRWLAIAPQEQPPDHYRLLGLRQFEADADVIESAADRQMAHVRSFQSGAHAADAQQILNEISAAKLVLLQSEKKAGYDSFLKARQQQEQPIAAPPADDGRARLPPSRAHATTMRHSGSAGASSSRIVLLIGAVAFVLLLLLGAALAMVTRPWEAGDTVADRETPEPAPVVVAPSPPISATPTGDPTVASPNVDDESTTLASNNIKTSAAPPAGVANEPAEPIERTDDDDQLAQAPAVTLPPAGPTKNAVPDKAARDAARAKIAGIFPVDDAATPAEKTQLARQLLTTARDTKSDPVAQFVLLNMARELAAEAAEVPLAFETVDMLKANFDFDTDPVRLATLGMAVKSPVPVTEKREVVVAGIEMFDAMLARDEYEQAGQLVEPLLDIARRARDKPALDALIERRTRAGEMHTAYKRAQTAFATLASDPESADANLVAGRFYLLAKSDWRQALPLLAKGSNAQLAAAAKSELKRPSTTDEEEKLADAWWTTAAAEKDALAQQLMQSRAMAWYLRAEKALNGLSKAKAQNRIKQLADAGVQPLMSLDVGGQGARRLNPGDAIALGEWIDLLPWANAAKGSPKPWTREESDVVSTSGASGKSLALPATVDGSYQLEVEGTVETAGGFVFIIPVGANRINVSIGGRDWTLQWVNGNNYTRKTAKNNFERNQRVRITITVEVNAAKTEASIAYAVNGEQYASWRGKPSSLGGWGGKNACPPSLGGWNARIRFHAARFKLLDGSATLGKGAEWQLDDPPLEATLDTIRNDRLLLVYTCEQSSLVKVGSEAAIGDVSGNQAHGILRGPQLTEGKVGHGLAFDGDDDFILIPTLRERILGEPSLTIACWIQAEPKNGGNFVFSVGAFAEQAIDVRLIGSESLEFLVCKNFGGGILTHRLETPEAWHHIAMVIGKSDMKMYVDGELVQTRAINITEINDRILPNVAARFGTKGKAKSVTVRKGADFKGRMDEIFVARRPITDQEVKTLFDAGQQGVSLGKSR